MDNIIDIYFYAALFVVALGVVVYALMLGAAVKGNADARDWFRSAPAQNIGIPCSAVASFVIVIFLLKALPPTVSNGGIELKAFGIEFSGPSGPITLWLLCFLGFVFALRLLRVNAGVPQVVPPIEPKVVPSVEPKVEETG